MVFGQMSGSNWAFQKRRWARYGLLLLCNMQKTIAHSYLEGTPEWIDWYCFRNILVFPQCVQMFRAVLYGSTASPGTFVSPEIRRTLFPIASLLQCRFIVIAVVCKGFQHGTSGQERFVYLLGGCMWWQC